ncbi:helix-hairpin-helix domain-containing protein [Vibrio marisflavi]|uniref:DNA uptake protein n=1 Tax=Vibrio marisflavi CECT 7928 TaxID=634439 RepID=A0ABN8E6G5_9VIBR|nr:helix-hairpin-helix domain-containing protein [Vibrio marisflavi]CAH0539393.1 hypothetical protein VMF7928_02111 [Vibrio marisflavi CECT 7928]
MSIYKSIFLSVVLLISLPIQSFANEPASHYEGIEITVNINSAEADELAALLLGVGLKKAQAIVEYRSEFGEFQSIEELTKVKGIGNSIIRKNKDRILL